MVCAIGILSAIGQFEARVSGHLNPLDDHRHRVAAAEAEAGEAVVDRGVGERHQQARSAGQKAAAPEPVGARFLIEIRTFSTLRKSLVGMGRSETRAMIPDFGDDSTEGWGGLAKTNLTWGDGEAECR